MYAKQTCSVDIAGKFRLRGMVSCEIKKSVHQIVQTAKIVLPLSILKLNSDSVLKREPLVESLKQGDTISIDLGYNGKNKREFTGYIKHINVAQPLELELEDEMYLFRKVYFKKSWKKASIKEVLNFLLLGLADDSGVVFELYDKMPELTLTNFVINGANGIEVLQSIADTYFLESFLTEINGKKVLYCGLQYGLKNNRVKYAVDTNTVNTDDLKYNTADAQKYYVKCINFNNDGSKKEFAFGDKKNTEVKKYYVGTHTNAELQRMAEAELAQQVSGYRGGLETMLIPNVQIGDIAEITDAQFKREGRGYIGTVTTTFGSGARRKVEIDISL